MKNNIPLSELTKTVIGIERFIENIQSSIVSVQNGSFPPYDITRKVDDENSYTVTLALSGYPKESIKITQEGRELEVAASAVKNNEVVYLHKGLTQKDFKRVFLLCEYSIVKGSRMKDGLLHIDVEIEVPDLKKPRKIDIS
ncbi:Hsp20 family protein [Vibrio sp. D431a]|uniref:Hsp20 family protein n=1 Tax=Vibrio sp. D431a TaxID=2837388 RepID=UPI002556E84B|nr:Hsp20 family protein [Vibrio sp. D431a]MDK9790141.1 Hsp20 family protein [Vibrio sp. D431a]